ncbi:protein-export chaperone SecB [Flavobacterium solisilvae]|uniref:Protein-export chaperone SecB n=1 Tax=Flavobacterium solisilvae TaxID=1852019 RepID=A0ABX1QPC2_9FLAO|nr:protein-export chaperone SecB [Flavobacterium solisilvae]NMH24051.1 protein-export chaperone SecB [Flavobacterium solisilvae]
MEKKNYKLLSITLINSEFNRASNINFESEELKNHVDIDVEDSIVDDKLIIALSLTVEGKIDKEVQYRFFNKFVGLFEIGDTNDLPVDKFSKANGPAIIFPFIREHVATTSLKANISPILLPPINFIKLSQEKKAEP